MAEITIKFEDVGDEVEISMSGDSPGHTDTDKMTHAQKAAYLVLENLSAQLAELALMDEGKYAQ